MDFSVVFEPTYGPLSTLPMPSRRSNPDILQERHRRVFVRLVFALYWLVIFEGVLRKWVIPQWSREVFFIRDPLILFIYAYAFHHRMRPWRSIFFAIGVAFAAITLPLICLQLARFEGHFSWPVAIYGWRNYFLYFPLAFLIAKYFDAQDIRSLSRLTLLVSIPIAVLVYFQFRAPGSAPINQGFGTSDEDVFKNPEVALGVVRTFGTFTSSMGQTLFVSSLFSMLLAAWLDPPERRPLKRLWMLAVTGSTLVCLGLTGSRTAFVWAGIAFLSALVAGVIVGPRKMNVGALLTPVVILAVAAISIPLAFPKAADAFLIRWEQAGEIEGRGYGGGGIGGRLLYDVFSFRLLLGDTPLQGYQMGKGGNGAGKVSQDVLPLTREQIRAAENDWGRHILELGTVIGSLIIFFRICLCGWMLREASRATRRLNSATPMIFFVLPGVLLLYGLITGNGTANGYAWLFAGFCMAINRAPATAGKTGRRLPNRLSSQLPAGRFPLTA